MAKTFKFRDYDYDVEKILNAIHSWIMHTNNIDMRRDFHLVLKQDWSTEIDEELMKNG